MKNNSLVIIVILLVAGGLFYFGQDVGLMGVYSRSALADCNAARQDRISSGYACVGECKMITQAMADCYYNAQGYDSLGDDVGNYGYFAYTTSCGGLSGNQLSLWQCVYGSSPGGCDVNDWYQRVCQGDVLKDCKGNLITDCSSFGNYCGKTDVQNWNHCYNPASECDVDNEFLWYCSGNVIKDCKGVTVNDCSPLSCGKTTDMNWAHCLSSSSSCKYDTVSPCDSCSDYSLVYNNDMNNPDCITKYNQCKSDLNARGFTYYAGTCSPPTSSTSTTFAGCSPSNLGACTFTNSLICINDNQVCTSWTKINNIYYCKGVEYMTTCTSGTSCSAGTCVGAQCINGQQRCCASASTCNSYDKKGDPYLCSGGVWNKAGECGAYVGSIKNCFELTSTYAFCAECMSDSDCSAWGQVCNLGGYNCVDTPTTSCSNPSGSSGYWTCNGGNVKKCVGGVWTSDGACGSGDLTSYSTSCSFTDVVANTKGGVCAQKPSTCPISYASQCTTCEKAQEVAQAARDGKCLSSTSVSCATYLNSNYPSEFARISGTVCTSSIEKYCTISQINEAISKYKQGQLSISNINNALSQYKTQAGC